MSADAAAQMIEQIAISLCGALAVFLSQDRRAHWRRWACIFGLAAIFLFIFKEAAPMVTKLNWVHFFTSPRWIPNPGEGNDASFGALALIVGEWT